MVYNAMKLFMEINPQLFDDCSHDYTEHQNGAEAREAARDMKWKALAEQANRNKAASAATNGRPGRSTVKVPGRIDEVDAGAEESRERLDGLKLGREERDKRPQHDRQGSSSSLRNARQA